MIDISSIKSKNPKYKFPKMSFEDEIAKTEEKIKQSMSSATAQFKRKILAKKKEMETELQKIRMAKENLNLMTKEKEKLELYSKNVEKINEINRNMLYLYREKRDLVMKTNPFNFFRNCSQTDY